MRTWSEYYAMGGQTPTSSAKTGAIKSYCAEEARSEDGWENLSGTYAQAFKEETCEEAAVCAIQARVGDAEESAMVAKRESTNAQRTWGKDGSFCWMSKKLVDTTRSGAWPLFLHRQQRNVKADGRHYHP